MALNLASPKSVLGTSPKKANTLYGEKRERTTLYPNRRANPAIKSPQANELASAGRVLGSKKVG